MKIWPLCSRDVCVTVNRGKNPCVMACTRTRMDVKPAAAFPPDSGTCCTTRRWADVVSNSTAAALLLCRRIQMLSREAEDYLCHNLVGSRDQRLAGNDAGGRDHNKHRPEQRLSTRQAGEEGCRHLSMDPCSSTHLGYTCVTAKVLPCQFARLQQHICMAAGRAAATHPRWILDQVCRLPKICKPSHGNSDILCRGSHIASCECTWVSMEVDNW
jgi:hypothetical protein